MKSADGVRKLLAKVYHGLESQTPLFIAVGKDIDLKH
jgi:hypothetical protein